MSHRNEEHTQVINPVRAKFKFNLKDKDATIDIYLSRLQEELLAIDTNL